MGKKPTQAMVKKETEALAKAGMDFEADAGGGLQETNINSFATPFLSLIQTNSKVLTPTSSKFVAGAKVGQFVNSVTKELFDSVLVVPAHTHARFVHWRDRDDGGGFLGTYLMDDPIQKGTTEGKSGKLVFTDGTYLAETRYHYVVIIKDDGELEPAVIGLASTQIGVSKNWASAMRNLRLTGKDGTKYNPPTYSHAYLMTSTDEAKKDYAWKGFRFDLERKLGPDDVEAYAAAKLFGEQVLKGVVGVDRSSYGENDGEDGTELDDSDAPM